MSMSKKVKTSYLWTHFQVTDNINKIATCDICGQKLNFKSTVTNLRKHIERRHTAVGLPPNKKRASADDTLPSQPSTSLTPAGNSNNESQFCSNIDGSAPPLETCEFVCSSSSSVSVGNSNQRTKEVGQVQATLKTFLPQPKKISELQRKKLDRLLLDLFTKDYQPFSVVEDSGFNNFVSALNPAYQLPNRKTIVNGMLPAEYERCLNAVRDELRSVESVCLSTDTWTSTSVESYMGITAHYVTDNFELKSVLLDCEVLPESHTSENLAMAIKKVTDKFHLTGKIIVVVSDNAANIKGAIVNELKWKYFPCFAHTINLVLQDALKIPKELIEKVKTIVSHFKRSTTSSETLSKTQRTMGLEPKKLKQEVATRWNSTFYMIERIVDLKDAVKTTIALINKDIPVLTEDEWTVCEELCTVLRPFEDVTRNMSGESYLTGSQVIGLANCLMSVCSKMLLEKFSKLTQNVTQALQTSLISRLGGVESNKTVALATLLDPRFKLAVFKDDSAARSIKNHCSELLAGIWKSKYEKTSQAQTQEEVNTQTLTNGANGEAAKEKFSVWKDLDNMIASKKPTAALQEAWPKPDLYKANSVAATWLAQAKSKVERKKDSIQGPEESQHSEDALPGNL